MTIKLRKVTKENWQECINLQVREEQRKFIASNLYSIAQVQFLENFEALAIYHNDSMVGFTLFGLDEDDRNYWIYRIMIDEKYQGQGHGKMALKEIIQRLKDKPDCKEIILGYHPENIGAEKMYISSGFQPKGMAPWGEKLASYLVANHL
ncbi:GNAT family N-acetyltransferase [Bacillus sp. MRMR6]|uniref:GNAT family N-acetyltransferase n=1 Tax=Bacillus sp. MRMR6 TaxID=1928617 RepID=UPI000951A2D9|nr:GNAT family N-acetyltransferase [Bacillus sp. MRMR6]OLS38545.1 spermidine acetyltransferase [Bacillus sp. MRMR6]